MEDNIQRLNQRLNTEQDTGQLNAQEFDLDIDGLAAPRHHSNNTAVVSIQDLLHSPQPEVANATPSQEENPNRDQRNTEHFHPKESYGPDNSPEQILQYSTALQPTGHYQNIPTPIFYPDKIPQLEEDWDNGQFTDADNNLINRHNMLAESERIRQEYSQHLLNITVNKYYSKENSINQLQYSYPDPDYYRPPPRRLQKQPCDPNGYYPLPPDPADVQCWHAHGRGKHALLHGHIHFGEKTGLADSRKARKRKQNYKQQQRKLSFQ